jgi:integrase
MGGIKQHGNGIQITFYWNGQRYRPTLKIPPTPANIKYAQRLKGEIERAIGLGTYTLELHYKNFPTSRIARVGLVNNVKVPTFGEISKKWKMSIANLAVGSQINYIKMLGFWLDKIGHEVVTEITYSTLASIANTQGWKPKYRNNMLIPLRKVFEMAYLDEIIEQNPTLKIKNSKVQKVPPDPFLLDERNVILEYMNNHYYEQVYNYFEFVFFSGTRPEEIIALKWQDVDFNALTVRIQRVRTYCTDRDTTKTSSIRDIELNSRALAALERQKTHTFLNDEYIFHNPVTNMRWNSEAAQRKRYWIPALKALGIRSRVQYQTRHTFATMNLMAGANPMWLSRQLGHSSMQMLFNVYAKWIDGADKSREVRKIEGYFNQDSHKPATKII